MSDTRPTVICLCGSTKFKNEFEQAAWEQTLKGRIILPLAFFRKDDDTVLESEQRTMLQHLQRQKIKMSDEILVVNPGGYIGTSTEEDIAFATSLGKRVEYLEPI